MKRSSVVFTLLTALAFAPSAANAAIIAGWNQNSNQIAPGPPAVFGFIPASFPQAKDTGPAAATHTIADFNTALEISGKYEFVESFGGTTVNDLAGAGAGGSFSFEGESNNGAKSVFTVPTTGYEDIKISWAQRGTATGFTSRVFEYSTDGGSSWVNVGAYAGSSGTLTSTFTAVAIDLSSIAALDNNANAKFRITYSAAGAGTTTGNNRWDNFYVEGTVAVPEPASLALVGLAGLAMAGVVRRRS